jgi:neural Wiskott-Aldrich syndrome protein
MIMTAMIVDEMAQIPMSPYLVATLKRAAEYAEAQSHLKVTLEHTLLALTEDPEASIILKSSSVEIERLQSDISNFLGNIQERQDPQNGQALVTDSELKRVLEAAAAAAQQGQRNEMNGAILLAAIIGDGRSNAAHILSAHGLTFEEVIDALKSQMRAPAAASEQEPKSPPPAPEPEPQASQHRPAEVVTPGSPPGFANEPFRPAASQSQPSPPPTHVAATTSSEPQSAATRSATTDEILATARQRVGSRASDTPPTHRPASSAAQPTGAGRETHAPPQATPNPHAGASSFEDGSAARSLAPDWQPIAATVPPPSQGDRSRVPQPSSSQQYRSEVTPDDRSSPSGQLRNSPPLSHRVPPPVAPNAGLTPPVPTAQAPTPRSAPMTAAGGSTIAAPPQLKRAGPMLGPASAPPWSGPAGEPHPGSRSGGAAEAQRRPQPPAAHRSTRIDIDTGALEDSIPTQMRAGNPELVEVRLARTGVKALAEGLEFSGAVHRQDSHLITKALSVKLRAPDGGFWVEAASPETQWIENVLGVMTDDYVSWRWLVTPKAKGVSRLQLVVSARTVGTDGLAAETAVPDRVFDIRVARNYRKLVRRIGGWVVAAAIGAAAVWFASPLLAFAKQTLNTFLTSANW